jgi:hypothetical protein
MREDTTIVIVVLAAVGLTAAMMTWSMSRGRQILDLWAQTNGYRINSSEVRWLRRGPFFWTTSKGQMVYYVAVSTPGGQTRRGYVRCGSFFWGLWKDQVEERWEE